MATYAMANDRWTLREQLRRHDRGHTSALKALPAKRRSPLDFPFVLAPSPEAQVWVGGRERWSEREWGSRAAERLVGRFDGGGRGASIPFAFACFLGPPGPSPPSPASRADWKSGRRTRARICDRCVKLSARGGVSHSASRSSLFSLHAGDLSSALDCHGAQGGRGMSGSRGPPSSVSTRCALRRPRSARLPSSLRYRKCRCSHRCEAAHLGGPALESEGDSIRAMGHR